VDELQAAVLGGIADREAVVGQGEGQRRLGQDEQAGGPEQDAQAAQPAGVLPAGALPTGDGHRAIHPKHPRVKDAGRSELEIDEHLVRERG
jgi:hypothetical protein